MAETSPTKEVYDDEIDLSLFFSVLWRRRKSIVFVTMGVSLLSALISLFIPRLYMSEGFYQLGSVKTTIAKKTSLAGSQVNHNVSLLSKKNTASIGVPIPLFKGSSAQFSNPNRFQLFASQGKALKEEDLEQLKSNFRTAADINKWIKPIYAYAKEDAREFSQLPKDESNSVIGLSLIYEADSPENARNYVSFFGNYIRDCLMYTTLYNYIMDEYNNTLSDMNLNENVIIDLKFQLQQNTNKLKDIRAIITNYPESGKIENRQVVSIQEGGDRFLSPVTQLVGLESTLADLRQKLAELERDKEKCIIRAEYFSRCNDELAKSNQFGESLFLLLKSIQSEVFKSKNLSVDSVREVFNSLSIDQQAFELAFFSNCRFVSGPTIPSTYNKPRKSIIVITCALVSFFSMILYAFVSYWWENNKRTIM